MNGSKGSSVHHCSKFSRVDLMHRFTCPETSKPRVLTSKVYEALTVSSGNRNQRVGDAFEKELLICVPIDHPRTSLGRAV